MSESADKKILIIAGPNGAGKTTFARAFLPAEAQLLRFFNADLIAAGLSPFSPESAALKAGRLMVEEIGNCVRRGESFAPMKDVFTHSSSTSSCSRARPGDRSPRETASSCATLSVSMIASTSRCSRTRFATAFRTPSATLAPIRKASSLPNRQISSDFRNARKPVFRDGPSPHPSSAAPIACDAFSWIGPMSSALAYRQRAWRRRGLRKR